MIAEKDVEQYLDKPVKVELTDGKSFCGVYWGWQLDVSDDVPNAMIFNPPKDMGLDGGKVGIEAARIVNVKPLS